MIFGTTFSHQYIKDYFKLPIKESFEELLSLKFKTIRLACYWKEIEKQKNQYDFSLIENILKMAQKSGQDVVMIIGMKAPRWPEFYLPKWTSYEYILDNSKPLIDYLTQCIKILSKYSCIKYWQIENEPLDKSGPKKLTIPFELLKKEIELVKNLDNQRRIIVTLWGNKLTKNNWFSRVEKVSDIIGLDLYYQIPKARRGYWGPEDSQRTLRKIIEKSAKSVWITELQTNPWKKYDKGTNEKLMHFNLSKGRYLKPQAILFWGFEYWLWKKTIGNLGMWESIKDVINKYQLS